MKVMLLNGSSNQKGCTYTALMEAAKVLEAEGIETELIQLGGDPIRDCIGCGGCRAGMGCVFQDDAINNIVEKAKSCDGFIFGTPVYYAHPSGRVLSALDRMFFSGKKAFEHKPGFAVASARRAGTTASLDVLLKYFTISEMPIVSSSYWTMVHGNIPEEVMQDAEGLQTVRNAAKNLSWLLKCIELGIENDILPPEAEHAARTNFIR